MAGASWSSATAPRGSTTTSGSRSAASSCRGPCRRARRSIRPSAGWRSTSRTTRSSTSTSRASSRRKQYGAGDVIVWDWGTWEAEAPTDDAADGDPRRRAQVHPRRPEAQGPLHDRPDQRSPAQGRRPGGARLRGRPGRAVAAHPQARTRRPARLGRRGPPAERQDRPDERRRQGRPRRPVERRGAGRPGRDRPDRRGRGADAVHDRADAGHPRLDAVRRPGLAVRDQVGRLPRPGRRRRRGGPDLDPQPQGRRDVFPAAAVAGQLDRRPAGDRRRRGRGHRRGRATGFLAAPDEARPAGRGRPRLPALRPAVSRWAAPAQRQARGSQAAPAERAPGPPTRALRRPRRGRGQGLLRGRPAERAGRHHRQAPAQPLRAGPALERVAQAQGPARAGAGHRRLDAGRGQRPRSRRAGRGLLRRRQAALRGQGRVRVHRRHAQGPAREAAAAGRRRSALRSAAAQGLQGPLGWRSRCRDLGPAGARHARRARRLDARRRRPAGRLQGPRAGSRRHDGPARERGRNDERGPGRRGRDAGDGRPRR